jgi:hypothetical protein
VSLSPRAFAGINALLGVALVLWGGTWLDGYQLHVLQVPLPHPYPWRGVLVFASIVLVESLALIAILSFEAAHPRLSRVAALALATGLWLLFALTLMHAAPYMTAHFFWLTMTAASLTIWIAATAARRFLVRAEAGEPVRCLDRPGAPRVDADMLRP